MIHCYKNVIMFFMKIQPIEAKLALVFHPIYDYRLTRAHRYELTPVLGTNGQKNYGTN